MYFSLVSIGRPDVGLALCEHLGVKDGEDWIYADPDNCVYDALVLNRGWDTMIRPATALRFRDRIFGGGGGRGEGSLDQVRAREEADALVPSRTMSPANWMNDPSVDVFAFVMSLMIFCFTDAYSVPPMDAAVRSPGKME